MKKLFPYLFLSLLVMGVASCSDEIIVDNQIELPVGQTLSVTGTILQDAETRVAFAEESNSITPSWEVGDQVFGFYGENKLTYRVASIADGVATFSLVEGTEPVDDTTVHMIYAPAKSASDLADGKLTVDLSQQDGTLAGVKNHAIMCATATVDGSSLSLQFENQVAIVGVKQFTGLKASTTYTSATFTSAGPTATVKVEGGVLKLVTDDAYGTITATGSFTSDASGNTTSTIYFAVPPTDAVAHTFELNASGDRRVGSISARAIEAGKYYYMYSKALTTGTAPVLSSAGCPNNECGWVQLWENGPKWAVYNVGVTDGKAENFGGYYAWGGCQDKIDDHYTGSSNLTGDTDAATKIWGSYWRMPTGSEIQALLDNCACIWTTQNGVNGFLCTGRGSYSCNSVFLPATGGCGNGRVDSPGGYGNYWSSTPDGSKAVHLSIQSHAQNLWSSDRHLGFAVRAVLAEE